MNLQGHRNDPVKANLVICSYAIDVSNLSCQAIIWISALVGLLRVSAIPVTILIINTL